MSITSKKITSTTVLKGVSPSSKALPVISNDINTIVDDLTFLDGRFSKALVQSQTPYTATTDTTAGWTLTEVTKGLLAGSFKSTSAAAVTLTLDSVANIVTAFASIGFSIGAGSNIQFFVDNSAGSNTVTVAVDGGATIAVATPVITGGATLTVSTANKIGLFNLHLTSATAGILSRII